MIINPTLKSLSKTLLWALANACFGLAPFMVVGFLIFVGLNNEATKRATHEFFHIINDGSLVFFFSALVGAVAIDLFFARKKLQDNMAFVICSIIFAILLVACVIIVYLVLLFTSTNEHVFSGLPRFQQVVAIMSVIFCILAKTILFLKEEKVDKKNNI